MRLWIAAIFVLPVVAQDGGKDCAPCHGEQLSDWKAHKHAAKGVACESCHGASQQHRNAVGATSPDQVAAPDEVPALCGSCHPVQRKEYVTSKHGKLVLERAKTKAANCATCHGTHGPRNAVTMKRQCDRCHAALPAACQRITQAAGKLICATCHAMHTLARK